MLILQPWWGVIAAVLFSGDSLNIASAYLKQVLDLQDFESWSSTRKHYLPSAYHRLFTEIDKHCEKFHRLPTFEDLKFEIRDTSTKELLFAIDAVEVEADPFMLLQYLKNEYTQKEILQSLEDYVDNSISFEDAEESVNHLHQIVLELNYLLVWREHQNIYLIFYLFFYYCMQDLFL